MRILSIGRPVAHPNIDNYSVFSAPAFSDFEAVIVDPGGIFDTVNEAINGRGDHHTYAGMAVVNGATGAEAISIADVLRRRLDETRRVLDLGGIVVVFGSAQATLPTVVGFSGADRYAFLPAPPGVGWGPPLLAWGEGATVAVTDHAHPFARYIDAVHDHVRYRAVFEAGAPRFEESATIFARTGGGAPVGVEFAVLGGRVVFLPAPSPEANVIELGASLEAAIRDLLARPDPGDSIPYWADSTDLPGLAPLLATVESARDLAARSAERAAAAAAEAEELGRVRDVLWREGRHGLLPAVIRCCELLGYRASTDERGTVLHSDQGDLLLEAEGDRQAVGMAPHYRLRARLDTVFAEGRAARGLAVVNGYRDQAPERRPTQYLDALRIAAEASRYGLLLAPDLFAAARVALEAPGAPMFAAIRTRLSTTDGAVTFEDLLGEA